VHSPLSSVIVAAAGSILLVGCGKTTALQRYDAAPAAGTGGTSGAAGATGASATGGAAASSGFGGGTTNVGVGGWGTGGLLGSGGQPVAGGTTGVGGFVVGTGGGVGKGGASGTVVGVGGLGAGGKTGAGGTLAAGGRAGTGGMAGSAGSGGGAGTTATGGAAGSTATPPFPPKFFGNVDTNNQVRADFVTYWDQFTPENIGKWAWVQGVSANAFSWERLDAAYKYCEDNHIIFNEHSFIWGSSQASWINESNAVAAVQNWMKAFCERYPKTRVINVVDEPLHTTPRYATWIGGGGGTTWDWVANSFKWAHEACPNAVLVLNEYNIIEYSSEHGRIITLAKTVLDAGAPVMAIGAQGHDVARVPLATVQAYVADIVNQTGLPVYITQLDLPVADDAQQAAILRDFVTAFWHDPSVPGITHWGYVVGRTWRGNTGLIKDDGTPRPAMTWLMDYLGR
jgi:endo-1,4-beta-xylanase